MHDYMRSDFKSNVSSKIIVFEVNILEKKIILFIT